MTKKHILMALSLITVTLSTSCGISHYKEPDSSSPHATVKSEHEVRILPVPKVYIHEVNGLPVNNAWKGMGSSRRLKAGSNSLYLSANTTSSIGASAHMRFTSVAGQHYVITTKNLDSEIIFRIYNDSTGRTVITKNAPKEKKSRNNGGFVPIFLPAG